MKSRGPLAGEKCLRQQCFSAKSGNAAGRLGANGRSRSQSVRKVLENRILAGDGFPRSSERGHIEAVCVAVALHIGMGYFRAP
jgi:hypothetical protein